MNKGFTLIELLAIIILLALITVIITFTANRTINSSKKSLYCTQVNNIIKVAKTWSTDNHSELPENAESPAVILCLGKYENATIDKNDSNKKTYIEACQSEDIEPPYYNLLDKKYLEDSDISNPESKKNLEGVIEITYNENTKQYNYKYTFEADNHDENYCKQK